MTTNRSTGSLRSTPTEDALTQMFDLQSSALSIPQNQSEFLRLGPEWIPVEQLKQRSSRIKPTLAVAAGVIVLLGVGVAVRDAEVPIEARPAHTPSIDQPGQTDQSEDVPEQTQPKSTKPPSTSAPSTEPTSTEPTSTESVSTDSVSTSQLTNVEIDLIGAYDIDTQTVDFEADSIRLTMNGETFDLIFELPLGSFDTDPNLPETESAADGAVVVPVSGVSNVGVWNRKTDLLLAGRHDGQTDRVFFDFVSDGAEWWASTIWVSDQPGTFGNSPHADGEEGWTAINGEFFRSPLGSKFVGDLHLATIEITGLEVEAFRRPPACLRPRDAVVLDFYGDPQHRRGLYLDYRLERTEAEVPFSLIALDPYACMPVPLDRDTVVIVSSENQSIVHSSGGELKSQDSADNAGQFTINLSARGPGSTDITVRLEDATGALLVEITVPVQVWDASGEYQG